MTKISVTSPNQRTRYEDHFDLRAVFEFSRTMNSSLELKFILGHLLLTLMGKLLSLRGIVLLRRDDKVFEVANAKGLPSSVLGTELSVKTVPRRTLYLSHEDLRRIPWGRVLRQHGIEIIIPLVVRDRTLGLMGFAASIKRKRISKTEEEYVKSLANIAAGAIERGLGVEELRQVNRRLDGKVQELNTLFEASKEFNALLDEDRLVKLLLFSVMGQVGATRYFICLQKEKDIHVALSRLDKPLNPELLTALFQVKGPLRVANLSSRAERRLRSHLQDIGVRVLVPMQMQQRMKGMLGIGDNMRAEPYSQGDLEFLSSLGNLAIVSLENARLFKEAIEKQRLEDELLIAREIQRALLPSKLPSIPHFSLAAINISSKQVGGDYYDVVVLDNDRFLIAIGDVSGKGTPASLLMANLQATIRALIPLDLSLSELTGRVNDLLCENTTSGRFITFFWGIVDVQRRTIRYVSAGHNPPFLLHSNGDVERLDRGGLVLGVIKTISPYQEGDAQLGIGDVLVLFTDGVSEAMSVTGEEFGEDQFEATLRSVAVSDSPEILSSIVDRVQRHSENTSQSDDITMIVLKPVS